MNSISQSTQNIKMDGLKNIPVLDEPQLYIYVMLNELGYCKIGVTKNIYQRYKSLSGSNSAGHKIVQVYCSPATYLYILENIMHMKYSKYRIDGTEWFYGDDLEFMDIVNELKSILRSSSYRVCNEVRKKISKKNIDSVDDVDS